MKNMNRVIPMRCLLCLNVYLVCRLLRLKDYDDESIRVTFYEAKLQKVNLGPYKLYQVEVVLDIQVLGGVRRLV